MRHPMLKLILVTTAVLLLTPCAEATTNQKLDLDQMVDRAGHVFRGTVLDVRTGTVEAGRVRLLADVIAEYNALVGPRVD